MHANIGKVSFDDASLAANAGALMAALLAARPKGLKGGAGAVGYVASAVLTSTQGKARPLALPSLLEASKAFAPS